MSNRVGSSTIYLSKSHISNLTQLLFMRSVKLLVVTQFALCKKGLTF